MFSIAVINTMIKSNLVGEPLFYPLLPGNSLSLREVIPASGQELKTNLEAGADAEAGHGRMPLIGLLSVACTDLIELRTTCPEVALPTLGWTFPHQSSIKKTPTGWPG